MINKFLCILISCVISACGNLHYKEIQETVTYWQKREILFPSDTAFVSYSRKYGEKKMSLPKGEYSIFCYVDSTGCMSCKLQLDKWGEFINQIDSISSNRVPFIFVFQSALKPDLIHFLKKVGFEYPLFIDTKSSFDSLNGFPTDIQYQTFLLDRNNRVLSIGNPIYNPDVRELYMDIIQGKVIRREKNLNQTKTKVSVSATDISLGSFNWEQEQTTSFVFKNTGNAPLAIQNVITSCGCLTVDYPKEPVLSLHEAILKVKYKADQPGYFNKTIIVYCSAEDSPFKLKVSGEAM